MRSVELTFGSELNPCDEDVDQEKGDEKLDGVWLDRRTIFGTGMCRTELAMSLKVFIVDLLEPV